MEPCEARAPCPGQDPQHGFLGLGCPEGVPFEGPVSSNLCYSLEFQEEVPSLAFFLHGRTGEPRISQALHHHYPQGLGLERRGVVSRTPRRTEPPPPF